MRESTAWAQIFQAEYELLLRRLSALSAVFATGRYGGEEVQEI